MQLATDTNHQFKLDSINDIIKTHPEDLHFQAFEELGVTADYIFEATKDEDLMREYYNYLTADKTGDLC